jgi:hypothetical protein
VTQEGFGFTFNDASGLTFPVELSTLGKRNNSSSGVVTASTGKTFEWCALWGVVGRICQFVERDQANLAASRGFLTFIDSGGTNWFKAESSQHIALWGLGAEDNAL